MICIKVYCSYTKIWGGYSHTAVHSYSDVSTAATRQRKCCNSTHRFESSDSTRRCNSYSTQSTVKASCMTRRFESNDSTTD